MSKHIHIVVNPASGKNEPILNTLNDVFHPAGVRLLFVREIARFIKRYPATNIIVLSFLIIIGIELSAQGLGLQVPEPLFNGLMLLALFVAIIYQWRFTRPARSTT